MSDNTLLPPQPDFALVDQAMQSVGSEFTAIGTELSKIQNIPGISQSNEILAAVQQLSGQVQQLTQQSQQQSQQIQQLTQQSQQQSQQIQQLNTQVSAVENRILSSLSTL
jgi:chromosome segregation ATPase